MSGLKATLPKDKYKFLILTRRFIAFQSKDLKLPITLMLFKAKPNSLLDCWSGNIHNVRIFKENLAK